MPCFPRAASVACRSVTRSTIVESPLSATDAKASQPGPPSSVLLTKWISNRLSGPPIGTARTRMPRPFGCRSGRRSAPIAQTVRRPLPCPRLAGWRGRCLRTARAAPLHRWHELSGHHSRRRRRQPALREAARTRVERADRQAVRRIGVDSQVPAVQLAVCVRRPRRMSRPRPFRRRRARRHPPARSDVHVPTRTERPTPRRTGPWHRGVRRACLLHEVHRRSRRNASSARHRARR